MSNDPAGIVYRFDVVVHQPLADVASSDRTVIETGFRPFHRCIPVTLLAVSLPDAYLRNRIGPVYRCMHVDILPGRSLSDRHVRNFRVEPCHRQTVNEPRRILIPIFLREAVTFEFRLIDDHLLKRAGLQVVVTGS